jgi:hypothetical protein
MATRALSPAAAPSYSLPITPARKAPPTPTGDSIASLLLGFPSEVERDVQFSSYDLRAWEFAGWAERPDTAGPVDHKAGLRYSLYPPLTEASGRMVNFNFSRPLRRSINSPAKAA